ncbi:putative ribonuclease H-like domain-containing protein [Tanacetum coccineum]
MVAQGYIQEEGIDYDEVFAPVVKIEAIRLFLAYASFKDFVVYQIDVKSTFLYGKIEEEVYVCQPPGFEDPDFPDRVYKVEKAMYRLHQAPRAWYETLSTYLLDNGFQRGKIDKTLFIKWHKDEFYGRTYILLGITKVKTTSTPIETQKPLLKDEDGEGSGFSYTQKPRKPKRKDTQVPQPSGPTEIVTDEAVHKELGDSLVRAAITASSLEAEKDSGNITKTRSNATPNESSSLGTILGGGPRVLDLGKTKTTQQNEIASSKRRVKKLEQKKRLRTHGLKRLHKVGMSRRVESSGDEKDLGEDASKQERRINSIDADKDVTLNKKLLMKNMMLATPTTTISSQQSQGRGKGIMIEEPVKPKKKDVQIMLDEEAAKILQVEFDEEERLAREKDKSNFPLY